MTGALASRFAATVTREVALAHVETSVAPTLSFELFPGVPEAVGEGGASNVLPLHAARMLENRSDDENERPRCSKIHLWG